MAPRHELLDEPARPLTLDQAYQHAYVRTRILFLSLLAVQREGGMKREYRAALDDIADGLEVQLTALLFHQTSAAKLARPDL